MLPLLDSFDRSGTDLRISVTDRCNFRCVYCMPPEGLDWLPREEVLSFEEILRLTGVLVGCGIDTIRLTGASRWPARASSSWWGCWRQNSPASTCP